MPCSFFLFFEAPSGCASGLNSSRVASRQRASVSTRIEQLQAALQVPAKAASQSVFQLQKHFICDGLSGPVEGPPPHLVCAKGGVLLEPSLT